MPKRQAEEIITREHGSTPNPAASSQPSGTMSSPAQINRRPIKQPRSIRDRHRSTTPVGSGSNVAQQQSMSFQPPNQSFTFGDNNSTTTSFPPASTSQFGGFGSGSTNGATSFTFGQSQPSTFNNPFAMNNNATSAQDNTMMDSSPQKPTTSIFNFGTANTNPQTTLTNGFNGIQSQSQPVTNNPFANIFGQQSNSIPQQTPSSKSNVFGGISQPQSNSNTATTANIFSQSTSTSNPFSFGTPAAQAQSTSPATFAGFGQAQQPSATMPGPAPAAKFVFGQTNVTDQPVQPVSTSSGLFGTVDSSTSATTGTATSAPLFNFATTSASKPPEDERPASQQSTSSFGSFGAFTGFGNKSAEQAPSAPSDGGLFGRVSAADTPAQSIESADEPEQTSRPVTGFDFKAASESGDESSRPKKSLFSFGTSGGMKESEPSRSPSPAKSDSAPPQFKFAASSTPAAANRGMFSAPSATTTTTTNLFAHLNNPASISKSPTPSLFGTPKPAPSGQSAPENTPSSTALNTVQETPKNIFGMAAAANTAEKSASLFNFGQPPTNTPPNAKPAPTNLSNMFNAASPTPPANQSALAASQNQTTIDEPPTKKRAFETSSSLDASAERPKTLFGNTFTPEKPSASVAPPQPVQPKLPTTNTAPLEKVGRAVTTEGPPQIPRNLNANKYKSYDESWRLRALSKCFQKQIAALDVTRMDPMNLIQNYLDHREAIGEGIGRYERKKASVKRKTDDVDDMQEDGSSNKRPQTSSFAPVSAPASTATPKSASTMFAGFGSTSAGAASQSQSSTALNGLNHTSTTPKSSPVKPMPTNPFVNASSSNPTPQSSGQSHGSDRTSNLFKAMIPGATESTSPTKPSSTAPASTGFKPTGFAPSMPKATGFTPTVGGANGGTTNFLNAFASNAAKEEEKIKAKRKAEEYDSDDSDADPNAWDSQYEAEQQAKRAKIESIAQKGVGFSFTPTGSVSPGRSSSPFAFGQAPMINGVSSRTDSGEDKENAIEIDEDDETEEREESGDAGDDEAEEPEEAEEPQEDELIDEDDENEAENPEDYTLPPGETSLFNRVSGKEKVSTTTAGSETPVLQAPSNNSFAPSTMFSNIGQSTPEQPSFSPFTPSTNKSPFKPAKVFSFTPQESAASNDGRSIFSGATLKAGPIPGEGLFGSRPSTPSNDAPKGERPALFSALKGTAGEDHTWKPSTPIKFGSSETTAPAVQVHGATPPPPKNPFASVFGTPGNKEPAANGASSVGFTFGQSSTAPAPSLLGVAPHLASSSRASSPGVPTDTESIATNLSEDPQDDPQTQLLASGTKLSGEENEDVLYESRAAGMRYIDQKDPDTKAVSKKWIKYGSGILKILKHKETGRTRILFRAEPGANVLLNVGANASIRYTAEKIGTNGALKFMVIEEINGEKKITPWMVRVKTPAMGEQMAEIMEREKTAAAAAVSSPSSS